MDEGAVAEDQVEVLLGLGVDPIVVRVGVWGEVDVGPSHVEKGERIAGGQGSCLGAVDDIVGRRDDAIDQIGPGTPRTEWAEADTPSGGGAGARGEPRMIPPAGHRQVVGPVRVDP